MFEKYKNNRALNRLLEERLYELAYDEIERNEIRRGLYAKAMANSSGGENKAKSLYVKYRVEAMKDEAQLINAIEKELEITNSSPQRENSTNIQDVDTKPSGKQEKEQENVSRETSKNSLDAYKQTHGSTKKSGSSLLGKTTEYALYIQIATSLLFLIAGLIYMGLWTPVSGDFYLAVDDFISSEKSHLYYAIIYIVSGAVILKWIHSANIRAREAGAKGLKFTAGWAVGWFFVPIANLWKPYQAFKEIWKASKEPKNWEDQSIPKLLPWWWFLFIASNLTTHIGYELLFTVKPLIEIPIEAMNSIFIFWFSSDIILSVLFLLIVKKINTFQENNKGFNS